jgi:hypothetical protein
MSTFLPDNPNTKAAKTESPLSLERFSGLESFRCYASSAKHLRPRAVRVVMMAVMSCSDHCRNSTASRWIGNSNL